MSRGQAGARILELALLVGVLVHFAVFLDGGPDVVGPPSNVEDWPKEFRYYTVLQQAVHEGRVPYFVNEPILITRKLLALPEVNTSPQILLLGLMPPGAFLVVNTLLLCAAGFAGLVLIRRRYSLGGVPFVLLVLLFCANGHITAQLAVGHSMWAGYFLLSFFVLFVLELAEDGKHPASALKLALLLFALLLQGSFHIFVWGVLFLLLLAAFENRLWPAVWRALGWAMAVGCVRLLPAYFIARRRQQAFLTGFPSLADLWHGLASVRDAAFPRRGGFWGTVDWWELDVYVGPAGLVFLAVFGLALARRYPALRDGGERALWGPLALMAVLSYGNAYVPLNLSNLPLLDAQRAASRLFAMPLVFLIVLASIRLERFLRERAGVSWRAAAGLLTVAVAAGLLFHSSVWRVAHLRKIVRERRAVIAVRVVEPPALTGNDRAYVLTVQGSAVITLVSLSLLLARLRLRAGEPTPRSPSVPASTGG